MKYRFFYLNLVFLLLILLINNRAYSNEKRSDSIIDPNVDKILQQMCDYLKSAEQFRFTAQATFEKVSISGQKLEYGETVKASIRRPDRFYADIEGDLIDNRVWYNGKILTMLDKYSNIYAITETPANIDSTLAFMAKNYGITAPLADLVISDPYTNLTQNVKSVSYVGLHEINGVKCHHLAFIQDNLDWQIWIEDSGMCVPRKLVITYKMAEMVPQYTAVLSNWDFLPHLPESIFSFIAPANSKKVNFMPVEKKVPAKIN
jgi:hypothetical protein